MLITLHGPDTYRRGVRLNQLRAAFLTKYPHADIGVFDGEDADVASELVRYVRSTSLFSSRRLVVLTTPASLPKPILKKLCSTARSSDDTHLIVVSDAPTITKEYAFLSADGGTVEVFSRMAGEEFARFVARHTREYGLTLPTADLRALARHYDGDSWGVVTDLMVRSFATTEAKLPLPTTTTVGGSLWSRLSSVVRGAPADRLAVLEYLLSSGEPAAKLFALLVYQDQKTLTSAAVLDRAVKRGECDYDEAVVLLAIC